MSKILKFDIKARESLMSGIDTLADAVSTTLGPKGKNVMIGRGNSNPIVTKDGVTVAKEINLEDPYENLGAQMAKEVASKTNDVAGDGTTTATVLARAIAREGLKNVAAGANPMDIKRGIDYAVNEIEKNLDSLSKKIDNKDSIAQVATISANNDEEIGNLLANALEEVGKEGVITVEESKTADTTLSVVKGMQFNHGFISPYFSQDNKDVVLEDALILLCNHKINVMKELLPILEQSASTRKPLCIIAEDVDGEALATLVINKMRGALNAVAVKAPGYGNQRLTNLEDIAILTGASVIGSEKGLKLEDATVDMLGQASNITISKDSTTIVGGRGDGVLVDARINAIRDEIDNSTNPYEKEFLQTRLAKLVGGVAVISVGAATEVEMREKKDRIDDAVHATKAAVKEGIVPGGGVALIRAAASLGDKSLQNSDQNTGVAIVKRAIEAPLRTIVSNAGLEGSVIVNKVKESEGSFGYNAKTDTFEDLVVAGVIDPTLVTKSALKNAASIATMMLTTDCVIVEKPEEKKEAPQMMMPPMM